MLELLSVNKIAFTILGYPMSYVEFVGTVLYLGSVWLIARRNMLTWPVGIISVLLYMILFYQINLYSDTLEQVYYLGVSIYGWWRWSTAGQESGKALLVRYSSSRGLTWGLAITLVISLAVGAFMSRVHLVLPALFAEPADYPYLDAFTTMMSFTAMLLMTHKRIESWVYWITVDVIGIWLYYVKEVRFISLLYVILLVMAMNGLITWHKTAKRSEELAHQPGY